MAEPLARDGEALASARTTCCHFASTAAKSYGSVDDAATDDDGAWLPKALRMPVATARWASADIHAASFAPATASLRPALRDNRDHPNILTHASSSCPG